MLVSIVSECSLNVAFSYRTIYGNFGTENMKTRYSTTLQSCTLLHVAALVIFELEFGARVSERVLWT